MRNAWVFNLHCFKSVHIRTFDVEKFFVLEAVLCMLSPTLELELTM